MDIPTTTPWPNFAYPASRHFAYRLPWPWGFLPWSSRRRRRNREWYLLRRSCGWLRTCSDRFRSPMLFALHSLGLVRLLPTCPRAVSFPATAFWISPPHPSFPVPMPRLPFRNGPTMTIPPPPGDFLATAPEGAPTAPSPVPDIASRAPLARETSPVTADRRGGAMLPLPLCRLSIRNCTRVVRNRFPVGRNSRAFRPFRTRRKLPNGS
mmetsp:Transcript_2882/g.6283  ORF Transcript_2882/g.6283 Transcript_2882/m.6283 type:complete len:209 (+) Transcript_2882:496-1122(+)